MEPISHLVKVSLPNYLTNLPLPDSIGGWFKLGFKDWLRLVPFGAAIGGLGYMSYRAFCPIGRCQVKINPGIKKDVAKVVDTVDIEDITDKAAFCRCWRSKKFPYCDGSHGAMNKELCENVGPIVVKHKD